VNRSKLDPNHITQLVYDEEASAYKVKLQDTEINLRLNKKEDHLTAHPAQLTISAIGCDLGDDHKEVIPAIDCSSLRQVRVDIEGHGTVRILASPNDTGDYFYYVGVNGLIHDICARRLKVESLSVIGNVHLVGRS